MAVRWTSTVSSGSLSARGIKVAGRALNISGWPRIEYFWQEGRVSDTVASLKMKISAKTSIRCDEFFLTFKKDVRLEDNCTLHSCNAQQGNCITVMPEQDCDQ